MQTVSQAVSSFALDRQSGRVEFRPEYSEKVPQVEIVSLSFSLHFFIEHAVHLVVLLGRHISWRVGVVVDPPTISFYQLFIRFLSFFLSFRALVFSHSLFYFKRQLHSLPKPTLSF